MNNENFVENYYQGIYLTETVMGNPNGDFVDNSPRNFDGNVFTTDKCIKYNVRKYIHDTIEDIENKKNIVFFFPRLVDNAKIEENKFQTRDDAYKNLFDDDFEALKENSPDVRMFGGTFSFKKNPTQIYGPIQISYGVDINGAQIKRLQIGAPFATNSGQQKTNGFEYVVDDAIISYDISINPNNYNKLLLDEDLILFKKSLWFGTNLRKSNSKKTDSKFLMLIKFKNDSMGDKVTSLSIGELNKLVFISNKKDRVMGNEIIKLNCSKLKSRLERYKKYIESIELIYDGDEIELIDFFEDNEEFINKFEPNNLL
ncbi:MULTISPECIES: type I CRISPR-associated protein Cas7 [Methanobrevibacter]|uniref:type I CRISPR-associated protein Cas7 n=1 Tax=Methanobrevibacter TaxID=2172 RepID=UPI00209C47B0|nr:type I CRISPR-associated protein Cas7 [Methanobrevibacter smithii]